MKVPSNKERKLQQAKYAWEAYNNHLAEKAKAKKEVKYKDVQFPLKGKPVSNIKELDKLLDIAIEKDNSP